MKNTLISAPYVENSLWIYPIMTVFLQSIIILNTKLSRQVSICNKIDLWHGIRYAFSSVRINAQNYTSLIIIRGI